MLVVSLGGWWFGILVPLSNNPFLYGGSQEFPNPPGPKPTITPPKFNMEPSKMMGFPSSESPFPGADLQVHVKLQLSHEKNPRILSMKSWLVSGNPYFMVYETIPIKLGSISSPIYTSKN